MKLNEMISPDTVAKASVKAHKQLDELIWALVDYAHLSISTAVEEGEPVTRRGVEEYMWEVIGEMMTDSDFANKFDGAIVKAAMANIEIPAKRRTKMSKEAMARDTEESDREYIKQRQRRKKKAVDPRDDMVKTYERD